MGRNVVNRGRPAGADAAELNAVLERLRLKGTDLARELGVSQDSVSRWRNGHWPVPGPVKAYLRLYERLMNVVPDIGRRGE